jgi:hypothetical protein
MPWAPWAPRRTYHDGFLGQAGEKPPAGRRQARAHDVGALEHERDGPLVDLQLWHHVRV